MKNNNGFTLVEMLAVIVLIAVLSVVAVSTYRGISESSKKKTLEAKIQQIETAAEKWARENNITNRMSISVNTLVVEGYLSADEVGTDGLALIKNPVNGKNMICNTIDLSFQNGVVISKFNNSVYNCKLASQSLVDSNIKIRVVSSNGDNLTGSGSIAKWTNKDIVIIVNSDTYDTRATSISYDFEGNTITKSKDNLAKYSGTSFVSETDSKLYYNVYYIKSELLLDTKVVVTYDIPGEGSKSRAYTIRFDKEEATATISNNTDWLTEDQAVNIRVDDGKGSGARYFYISRDPNTFDRNDPKPINYKGTATDLEIGKYYVWTEDNAGNISKSYKLEFEINNIDPVEPGCEILFHGTEGDNGWYISNVTPGAQNTPPASISGVNIGISRTIAPIYTGFASYQTQTEVQTDEVTEETTRAGINYYCFAKSLAGKTGNATRNLKIDKTPPTLEIEIQNPSVYTQDKKIEYVFTDNLSGAARPNNIRFEISNAAGTRYNLNYYASEVYNAEGLWARGTYNNLRIQGVTLTGVFYLWIYVDDFKDIAGNPITEVTVNGNTYSATGAPFRIPIELYFDNTKPSCSITNLTNQCTTNGIAFNVSCSDAHSGCASGAGAFSNVKEDTRYTVTDGAGNSNFCIAYVDSTNQYRRATCNRGKRCKEAGCQTPATCTNTCCGTHPVSTPTTLNHSTCNNMGLSWVNCGGSCPEICYYDGWCCYATDDAPNQCSRVECCGCATYNRDIDLCGCDTWNEWQPWQNTEITDCDGKQCKTDTRTVYHSRGLTCDGDTSGGEPEGNVGICAQCVRDSQCPDGSGCNGRCSSGQGFSYSCCTFTNPGGHGLDQDVCN